MSPRCAPPPSRSRAATRVVRVFTPPFVFSRAGRARRSQDDLDLSSLRLHATHLEKELGDARAALEEQSAASHEDASVYRRTIHELHAQVAALHEGSAEATALGAASLDRIAQLEGDAILMQVRRLLAPLCGLLISPLSSPSHSPLSSPLSSV